MTNNFNNIVLNEKGVKDMKKNAKKKKGFTLVELIAVIAILGILAAVIVPKVTSYTSSAKTAAKKTDASSIINGIAVYNAQASSDKQIATTTTMAQVIAGNYDGTNPLDTSLQAYNDLKATVQSVTNKASGTAHTGSADVTTDGTEIGVSTPYSALKTLLGQ